MNVRRFRRLEPSCAPLTPTLPISESAHNELVKQNKKLKHLLSTERQRSHKIQAVLCGALDELQTSVTELRKLVIANLANGLQPHGEQR